MPDSQGEFVVSVVWTGWVASKTRWFPLLGRVPTEVVRKPFAASNYVFNLTVTETTVALAGPGFDSSQSTSFRVMRERSSLNFLAAGWLKLNSLWQVDPIAALSEYEVFTSKAEGWLVGPGDCPDVPGAFVAESDPEHGGFVDHQRSTPATGIVLGFKGSIDTTPVTIVAAAPTISVAVPMVASGPSATIAIPVGPAVTTTNPGAHYVAYGKFQLCPDGGGGLVVSTLEMKPSGLSEVGPWEIVLDWELHQTTPE